MRAVRPVRTLPFRERVPFYFPLEDEHPAGLRVCSRNCPFSYPCARSPASLSRRAPSPRLIGHPKGLARRNTGRLAIHRVRWSRPIRRAVAAWFGSIRDDTQGYTPPNRSSSTACDRFGWQDERRLSAGTALVSLLLCSMTKVIPLCYTCVACFHHRSHPVYVIQFDTGLKERTPLGLKVRCGRDPMWTWPSCLRAQVPVRATGLGGDGRGGTEIVVGRCPGTLLVPLSRVGEVLGAE